MSQYFKLVRITRKTRQTLAVMFAISFIVTACGKDQSQDDTKANSSSTALPMHQQQDIDAAGVRFDNNDDTFKPLGHSSEEQ